MSQKATIHAGAVAEECLALAGLLEASPAAAWDAPSLCEGWRTREVVAPRPRLWRCRSARSPEWPAAAGAFSVTVARAAAAATG